MNWLKALFGGSDDGGHWQTSTQIYSDPGPLAGPGSSGAFGPVTAASLAARNQAHLAQAAQQRAAARYAGAINISSQLAQAQQLLMQRMLEEEPVKEPESDGVRVGEILAWRAWRVKHGWLYSMVAEEEWAPNAIIQADEIGVPKDHGVHAWKQRLHAIEYAKPQAEQPDIDDPRYNPFRHSNPAPALVIGQVALWGQIYEFEKGWHGEYARIHSLEMTFGDAPPIEELRKTYSLDH